MPTVVALNSLCLTDINQTVHPAIVQFAHAECQDYEGHWNIVCKFGTGYIVATDRIR
jgi:hypothetical protein